MHSTGEQLLVLGVLFVIAYVLGRLGKLIGLPAMDSVMAFEVACDTGAAANTGATASVETAAAPMIAPIRNTRRFKMDPPGRASRWLRSLGKVLLHSTMSASQSCLILGVLSHVWQNMTQVTPAFAHVLVVTTTKVLNRSRGFPG